MHCIFCDYSKLGCWGPIFVSNYAHMSNEIVLNEMVWNWSIFWVRLLLLCAWNSAKVCMSRSGEPGSPRQNMQGVTSLATPPRAPEALRLLQPNAPQPLTLLRPFILGGLLPVGIEPPTWPLTPLAHQQMLPVALQHNW